MTKVRWGILSTSNFAQKYIIPAVKKTKHSEVVAICSRDMESARKVAQQMGIPKAYGSYEALLEDPMVDLVYNPLPNHMHVKWSIKALEAGKHVLCEKPIGLNTTEATKLLDISNKFPELKVMEGFMYRHHPQWQKARQLVEQGRIGELRTIQCFFSYNNPDPKNIRNRTEVGGGGMMDIGCYCISQSRFIFAKEPKRVVGILEFDPLLKTDRLASGILDYGNGATATFTCSTQLMPYQRVNILGTTGRIEIEIPFNAPIDQETKVWLFTNTGREDIVLASCDQYTVQAELFAKSILENGPVPTPLHDAVHNMKVLDAIRESNASSSWQEIN